MFRSLARSSRVFLSRRFAADAGVATPEPQQSFFKSDKWIKTVGTVGALANWTIPLAGIAHMRSGKDPATTIDPVMTTSLIFYSMLFMRWALAISPYNPMLFVCHFSNECIQLTQMARYLTSQPIIKKELTPKIN
jgi:hypothetical protein